MESTKKGEYPRFNMPFEIGLDYGCRSYGKPIHKKRRALILAEKRYGYQRALSDLAGVDIASHNSEEIQLIRKVRNWIRGNLSKRNLKSGKVIWDYYMEFLGHFGMTMEDLDFSKEDLEDMHVNEFIDNIKNWIKNNKSILK